MDINEIFVAVLVFMYFRVFQQINNEISYKPKCIKIKKNAFDEKNRNVLNPRSLI